MRRRAPESALRLLCLSILLLAVVGSAGSARAGKTEFGASWNVALPLDNTSDFAKTVTARSFTLEYHRYLRRDTSWGINAGWTVFNHRADDTTYGPNWAITGQRWNTINAVPLYASTFHYWGDNRRRTSVFAGANLGATWAEYRTTVGLYEFKDQNWHLAVAPEIGLMMPRSSVMGFISVRYNLLMKAGDIDTQSWIELRIGFGR